MGRPTNHSITLNVVSNASLEAYIEYSTTSGVYTNMTPTVSQAANDPIEIVIDGLSENTKYYYRLMYRVSGSGGSFTARDEHSFQTQRPSGSTFTFTIIADSHMSGGGGNVSLYQQTLTNVNNDHPDFHFDLGDTFWTDAAYDVATTNQRYLAQRQWMGVVSHSASIFVAPGNHENEEGWNFDDVFTSPDQSLARVGMKYRKLYYPNPIPDDFYTGNTDPLDEAIGGDTNHEDLS